MKTPVDKSPEPQQQAAVHEAPQQLSNAEAKYEFVDNREETVSLRKMQEKIDNSPRRQEMAQLKAKMNSSPRRDAMRSLQAKVDNSPRMQAQRKSMDVNQYRSPMQLAGMNINDEPQLEHEADVMGAKAENLGHQFATQQLKEDTGKQTSNTQGNDPLTGFLNLLKVGFATMGHDINPTVHYNSTKPAQLSALAYAQGNDIHLGAGQEQHLPHEAWHVLQQKQGRVASTAQFFGHETRQAPLNLGESAGYSHDEMSYTSMSDAAYADWRQTVQCKMGLHGAHSYGGKTTVAQFNNPAEVMQMISLSKNAKVVLLVIEGVLTIAAGIGAMVATSGVGVLPALMAVAVGVVKLLRAYKTYKGKKTSAKVLRFIEAGLAIVGGLSSGNPAIIVFAFAKLLRSILEFFVSTDEEGEKEATLKNKVIMSVSTVLHAVEVVALAFAGGANIAEGLSGAGDASLVLGGAAVVGVAASKGIRTADQGKEAYEAATEKDKASVPAPIPAPVAATEKDKASVPAPIPAPVAATEKDKASVPAPIQHQ